jgi:hypothetical protein
VPEIQGVLGRVGIVVATYSKALGSYGGFVACDAEVREHFINHARPFIYTTSLPVPVIAANIEALRILRTEGAELRHRLASRVALLRSRLEAAGFEPTGMHHILSVPVQSPELALNYSATLEELGLLVYPMRWPSVPRGQDALRISVSAGHSDEDIGRLAYALRSARDRAAGKDTTNLNKRSARRPEITELDAAAVAEDTDVAAFDEQDLSDSAEASHEDFGFAEEETDSEEVELTSDDLHTEAVTDFQATGTPSAPEASGTSSRQKARKRDRKRDRKRARSRDSA